MPPLSENNNVRGINVGYNSRLLNKSIRRVLNRAMSLEEGIGHPVFAAAKDPLDLRLCIPNLLPSNPNALILP